MSRKLSLKMVLSREEEDRGAQVAEMITGAMVVCITNIKYNIH